MLKIIENFPILFDSKEKVKELRNLILSLAIQGKLVPQDPKDEPASVLLKRIEEEKKRLIQEKTIKKDKSLPPINADDVPFELPKGWEWVRLGEFLQLINGDRGKNYPSKDKLSTEGIPFISAINIQNGEVASNNLLCLTPEQYNKLGSGKLNKNDIVFCIRGSLGKNAIYKFENGAIASSLVILRQYKYSNKLLMYLYYYL
jgi:type I restriction enzyme S subunit